MRGRLALLLAMAHRPELLILDEPTSGLDVIVRHDFLKGVIEHIHEDDRTVFFSTHQVSEVEKVADWVGIIDHGELIWCSSMEDLKDSLKRVVLTFDVARPTQSDLPDLLRVEKVGRQTSLTIKRVSPEFLAAVNRLSPSDMRVEDLPLERIFMDMVSERTPWAIALVLISIYAAWTRGYTFYGTPGLGMLNWSIGPVLIAFLIGASAYSSELTDKRSFFLMTRPITWRGLLAAKLITNAAVIICSAVIAAAEALAAVQAVVLLYVFSLGWTRYYSLWWQVMIVLWPELRGIHRYTTSPPAVSVSTGDVDCRNIRRLRLR